MMSELAWDGKPFKKPCATCKSDHWYEMRSVIENNEVIDWCSDCSVPVAATQGVPDVYFKQPYKSEALDVEFTSKAQKARYLKEHDLTEAGDVKLGQKNWIEGSRDYRKKQFEKDRPMIREAYRRYLDRARS